MFSLDAKQTISGRFKIIMTVGLVLYLALTAAMITAGGTDLGVVSWLPIAQSLVVGTVTGITALLLYSQGRAAKNRGYLWLASGYLYLSIMNFAVPLVWPDAFGPGTLLGGDQSAPYIIYARIWALPIFLLVGAWLLQRQQVLTVPPVLRHGIWPRIATACGLAAATLVIVVFAESQLPALVTADDNVTTLARVVGALWLVWVVIATVMTVTFSIRWPTVIHRWIAAIMVVMVGAGVVNLVSDRWSAGWYYNKILSAVATSLLLAVLLLMINRIFQSTSIASAQDPLTKSDSRMSLTEWIGPHIERGHGCTFMWIDIDNFKTINDEMGHDAGDEALRILASRMTKVAEGLGRLGRLGGDEFGFAIAHTESGSLSGFDKKFLDELAQEILAAGREPVELSGTTSWLSFSIGIASAPQDAATTSELMQRADLSMYVAKAAGGDRLKWFDETISQSIVDEARLRHQLNQSIKREDFDLDYQPIVTTNDHKVVGVEALVRWLHDDKRVTAGEFIEFAERTGQIVGIGRQVIASLETNIDLILRSLPPEGFVTFNLSVQEIVDEATTQQLLNGPLADKAKSVTIEVTESLELHNKPKARDHLNQLSAANYRIAIDDFGTGFSNLTRLQGLRPHLLKIDRSIVVQAGIPATNSDALLRAAIEVARSLNCQVLAEGVESSEETAAIESHQVDYIQGHRFGRPVALHTLLQQLDNRKELPIQRIGDDPVHRSDHKAPSGREPAPNAEPT